MTREAWKSWTRRTWADAWKAARPSEERPPRVYDLRHSYVSLLLAEGRTIHYVATQAGHDAQLTLSTYGHLLAEYADADRIDAEQEITAARQTTQAARESVRPVLRTPDNQARPDIPVADAERRDRHAI